MNKIIITCDDCGLSEGINRAALELYQKGLPISPSVMMNFAASRHALDLFAAYPALDIGIHLNLTDGFPVMTDPPPSQLTRGDGRFRDRSTLWYRALLSQTLFLEQAKRELTAQLERFIAFGRRPGHLTTHTHFHVFPALYRLVEQLAGEYGIPWIRASRLQATVLPFNPFCDPEKPTPNDEGGLEPDFLIPIKYWLNRPPEELAQRLHSLPGTVEIVVHPCADQDDTFPPGVLYSPHERHLEMVYLEAVMAL
jgi:hypothetical protein